MVTQRLPTETVMAIVSVPQLPTRIAMVTQQRLIVTVTATQQERPKAIRTAMEIPQPHIQTPTVETGAYPIPIVIATAIQRPPIETIWARASVHHRATQIRLVIPLLSSVAITRTHPFGRGNFTQYDIKQSSRSGIPNNYFCSFIELIKNYH